MATSSRAIDLFNLCVTIMREVKSGNMGRVWLILAGIALFSFVAESQDLGSSRLNSSVAPPPLFLAASVNRPPEIITVPNQTINEGALLVLSVFATDPDGAAQQLTFTLGPEAPLGATITPGSLFSGALFLWTPTEEQGPATYEIPVIVTDNGLPSLSVTQTFSVIVREVNSAPLLNALTNFSVREGEEITFLATALDPDLPSQTLSFSLGAGAPAGALMDAETGVFTWTPNEAQGGSSYQIGVIVTDNGGVPLSVTITPIW